MRRLILVTGDRNYSNHLDIKRLFDNVLISEYDPNEYKLIHGGCKGADLLTASVACTAGYDTYEFAADWDTYGRSAGPIRNKEMINLLPKLIIIFHDDLTKSKGTKNCLSQLCKLIDSTTSYKPIIYLNGILTTIASIKIAIDY